MCAARDLSQSSPAWRASRFELVTSLEQLDELRCVSRYPKLKAILPAHRIGTMVNSMQRALVLPMLPPLAEGVQATDPNDTFLLQMAVASAADYLVTGDVDQVWLREKSATDLSTQMRVNYSVANRQSRIYKETLNASQSRTVMPTGSAADNIMLDTLRELIKPMAQKIVQAIEAKK